MGQEQLVGTGGSAREGGCSFLSVDHGAPWFIMPPGCGGLRGPPMTATGLMVRVEPSVELWRHPVLGTLSRVPCASLLGLVDPEAICCAGLSFPTPACHLRLTLPLRDGEWREGRGIRVRRQRPQPQMLY